MNRPATVKVTIFGIEFSFKTDDPEHIQELAAYLDQEIQKIVDSGRVSSQTKAVILCAFTIADELFRLKQDRQQVEKRLDSLLEISQEIKLEHLQPDQ